MENPTTSNNYPVKGNQIIGFVLFLLSTVWIFFNQYHLLPIGAILSVLYLVKKKLSKMVLIAIIFGTILGGVGTGFSINLGYLEQPGEPTSQFRYSVGYSLGINHIAQYFMKNILIVNKDNLPYETVQNFENLMRMFRNAINDNDMEMLADLFFFPGEIIPDKHRILSEQLKSVKEVIGEIHSINYIGNEDVTLTNEVLLPGYFAGLYEITSITNKVQYLYVIFQQKDGHMRIEHVQTLLTGYWKVEVDESQ